MSSSKVEYFIGGGGDKSDFITSITSATNIMRRVKEYRANTTSDIYCQYYGHEEKPKFSKISKRTGKIAHTKA